MSCGRITRSFVGRPGSIGDRAGNFAVQNADLLIVLGCRLNIRQIGYEFAAFARAADLVVVDIDAAELAKPTISPDLAIHAEVGWFVRQLARPRGRRTGAGLASDRGWHGVPNAARSIPWSSRSIDSDTPGQPVRLRR